MKEKENKKTTDELVKELQEKALNAACKNLNLYKKTLEELIKFVNSDDFLESTSKEFNVPLTTSKINLNDENELKKLPNGENIAQIMHDFVEETTKALHSINTIAGYIVFYETLLKPAFSDIFNLLTSYPASKEDFLFKCAFKAVRETLGQDSDLKERAQEIEEKRKVTA